MYQVLPNGHVQQLFWALLRVFKDYLSIHEVVTVIGSTSHNLDWLIFGWVIVICRVDNSGCADVSVTPIHQDIFKEEIGQDLNVRATISRNLQLVFRGGYCGH